jgi:protein TonB
MPGKTQETNDLGDTRPVTALGRCLVDGDPEATSLGRRARRKTFGASLLIETLLLGALVAAPLLTSVAQPTLSKPTLVPFVFTAPHPIRRAPLPANPVRERPVYSRDTTVYEPSQIPRQPIGISESSDDATPPILDEFPGEARPGTSPFVDLRPSGIAAPPEEIKKAPEKHPLKVSEPVIAAQLLSRVEPRYPVLSIQLRMAGTVVLHAIIGRDGRINALQVVSGSPFFTQAALDAVRQWRYRPTILDGEPVEVETTITVMFQLQH